MTGSSDLTEKHRALRDGQIGDEYLYDLIQEFGKVHFVTAAPDVARLLQHADPQIRYMAINVLTFDWDLLKYRDAVEPLVADPIYYVRQQAIMGLGYLLRGSRDVRATKLFLQKLKSVDEDGSVREAAYEALLDMWLPPSKRAPTFEQVRSGLPELSKRATTTLALSRELGRAKASGDSERVLAIAEEMRIFVKNWDESWQARVDWEAVAAIERGEPPTQ